MQTKIEGTMFIGNSTINTYLTAFDLTDSGKKVFGSWKDFNFTTTTDVTNEYKKKMCNYMLQSDECYFVQIENYFAIKPNIWAFSNGSKFISIHELKQSLLSNDYIEVQYKQIPMEVR